VKLENMDVSSQGNLALQLRKAKSKSKSGVRRASSRDPAQAPQADGGLSTSLLSLVLPCHEGARCRPLPDAPFLLAACPGSILAH